MKRYEIVGILVEVNDETTIYHTTDSLQEAKIYSEAINKAIWNGRVTSVFDGREDTVLKASVYDNQEHKFVA